MEAMELVLRETKYINEQIAQYRKMLDAGSHIYSEDGGDLTEDEKTFYAWKIDRMKGDLVYWKATMKCLVDKM